tara:strand:+ start:1056 stop:1358 length:303 start_codon:yes stop_codon:yes gene_type:complete
MATKEELQAQADAEVEAAKPLKKNVNGVESEFTEEDYTAHKLLMGEIKWRDQQEGYIFARQEAYGSIANQLDMQYWDQVNSTTVWKDHIAKVKSDNPKPE